MLISILIVRVGFTQDLANAKKYYKQGVDQFLKKNYKTADSLFSLSLKAQQHPSTFYNLAVTKKMLGENCQSCLNLKKAAELSNEKAKNLYNKRCCNNVKVNFKGTKNYTLVRKGICDEYNVQVYNSVDEAGKVFSYVVENIEKGIVVGLDLKIIVTNGVKEEYYIVSINENASLNDIDIDASIVTKKFNDRKASFPGGNVALTDFLSKNVAFAQNLKERDVFGKVVIAFDVDELGNITNVNILKHGGEDIDKEAISIVNKMPKWIPAERDGKTYKSHYLLPINFNIIDFGEGEEIEDDNQSTMDAF